MQDQIAPLVLGALTLVTLALVIGLWRGRSRVRRELAEARAESADLRAQVAEIERQLAAGRPASGDYVITQVGEEPEAAPVAAVDRALFADLVLRESLVKAAGLAHGLRRALSPETRNRIRFEMRREVKRSRKQRRADVRQAVREWEARQRAGMDDWDAA